MDYIRALAKNCDLGINGDSKRVKNLIANNWYKDLENNI